ncbi:MAG: VOC family protein [Candidatus Micrarchaeota archaeon]|nr:VOC family protein [Candidatus Micrarchaeota archaeon]
MTSKEFVPFSIELQVSNLQKSLKFYSKTLGFQIVRFDKKHKFAVLCFNNSFLMIRQVSVVKRLAKPIQIRFILKDVKSYYRKLKRKRVDIVKTLQLTGYGLNRFCINDPDGYELKFGAKR